MQPSSGIYLLISSLHAVTWHLNAWLMSLIAPFPLTATWNRCLGCFQLTYKFSCTRTIKSGHMHIHLLAVGGNGKQIPVKAPAKWGRWKVNINFKVKKKAAFHAINKCWPQNWGWICYSERAHWIWEGLMCSQGWVAQLRVAWAAAWLPG